MKSYLYPTNSYNASRFLYISWTDKDDNYTQFLPSEIDTLDKALLYTENFIDEEEINPSKRTLKSSFIIEMKKVHQFDLSTMWENFQKEKEERKKLYLRLKKEFENE